MMECTQIEFDIAEMLWGSAAAWLDHILLSHDSAVGTQTCA